MRGKNKYVVFSLLLIACLFGGAFINQVHADENDVEVTSTPAEGRSKVNVYMFRGEGCGFCAKALAWFEEIEPTESQYYNLVTYEVWNDETNQKLMNRVASYMGDDVSGVPYIIIGKKTYQGFDDKYKEEMLDKIHEEYNKNAEDRFDVMKDIENDKDKDKGNITTYIICGVVLLLIVFVIFSRRASSSEDVINYEDDKNESEKIDLEVVEEEPKKEVKKETKKETTTKKTKSTKTTTKKNTTKKSKTTK